MRGNIRTRFQRSPWAFAALWLLLAMNFVTQAISANEIEIKPSIKPPIPFSPGPVVGTTVTLRLGAPLGEAVEPFWTKVVGSCHGPLWAERSKDMAAQLAHVRSVLGIQQVRFHNILSCIPKPVSPGVYDFSVVDRVYDAVCSTGVKPLVEVSFMPPWLASGTQTVFEYKANVTPPRDMKEWRALIKAFTQHLINRYGLNEVRSWGFEIWNEPDLPEFWAGDLEASYQLFVNSIEAILEVDPMMRVGGPAAAGSPLIGLFLDRVDADETRVDFVTWHLYGGRADDRDAEMYRMSNLESLRNDLNIVGGLCRSRGLPLIVTEWNSTPHPWDGIHDSALNAAFALNLVREARGNCDVFSYWAFSDIFAEQGVPTSEFSGGFGLLSLRGLEKPVFKAFEMLELTKGGLWIMPQEGPDVQALASWSMEKQRLVILLWNWPYDSGGTIDLQAGSGRRAMVRLANLPPRRWGGRIYRLDAVRANATNAWKKMGNPAVPSGTQMTSLREAARLVPEEVSPTIKTRATDTVRWSVELGAGDCCALVMTPVDSAADATWVHYN